jgi:pantothenate kinase
VPAPAPPPRVAATAEDLARRALDLLATRRPERVVLGLVGAPGAGKSTLAERLVAALPPGAAVVLPMDGFHLAQRELERLGLADRKGAPETFDGWGFAATLARVAARDEPVVHVPAFDRDLEEPIAGAIAIPADVPLVVIEGNYLLLDREPWSRAREAMTEVWFLDPPEDVRRERLAARHVRHGRTEEAATAWITAVDEPNARLVASTRDRADLVVRVSRGGS